MKEMSKFLSSLEADPEEQRFNKAAIHLRTLIFGRLSDDHVVALALLHELGGLYRRAYGTDQVLHNLSAQRDTQEEALEHHLRSLGLPCTVDELEPCEVQGMIDAWEEQWPALPRPFDKTLQTFVVHAKTHLNTSHTHTSALRYQVH